MGMIIIQSRLHSNLRPHRLTLNAQYHANPSFSASRLRLGLGTFIAIEAEAASGEILQAGLCAGFLAIARVERLMHPTRAGSDLERLRRAPKGLGVAVDAWTWAVLALCTRLNRLTHGTFDPCLPGFAGRMGEVELPSPQMVVQRADLQLDLGGVAKGFAVDRAIDALRAAGCRGGIVNAGGDLAVFGDRRYGVVAKHAHGEARLRLRNMALATSVVSENSRPKEHQGYYSGRDGRAIVDGSISIVAPTAVVADALTKCVLSGGCAANPSLLETFDAKQVGYDQVT
jgi:thiamine biosynthesis lipoprotein